MKDRKIGEVFEHEGVMLEVVSAIGNDSCIDVYGRACYFCDDSVDSCPRCSGVAYINTDKKPNQIQNNDWMLRPVITPKKSPYADFKVDDKILVSNDNINWMRGHFSGITPKEGLACIWDDGLTSFTDCGRNNQRVWKYCKKWEDEE